MQITRTYEEFEEPNHSDNSENVRSGRHERSKLGERGIQHRSKEERDDEHHKQHCSIPNDRSKRHERNANQRTWRVRARIVREGLDEHIRDNEQEGHHDREDDLRKDNRTPTCPGNITRQLFRRQPKFLPLVTSNHSSG